MLVSARSIDTHIDLLKHGRWERSAGVEISGKTVGFLGLGNIGKRIVELLAGFGIQVIAYDPQPDEAWASGRAVRFTARIEDVFAQADFLILALPCNEQTRNIVNKERLGLMKPTSRIINTARGGLIDEAALCEAIGAGKIAGAALDAFEQEPLPVDSQLRMPGITLTPHMAATSIETAANISWIVARNIVDIMKNGRTQSAVNKDRVAAAAR
jgi:D-3-phosphoglycerate dehydrogenase/(S)-sulfolactate dehydrogenase